MRTLLGTRRNIVSVLRGHTGWLRHPPPPPPPTWNVFRRHWSLYILQQNTVSTISLTFHQRSMNLQYKKQRNLSEVHKVAHCQLHSLCQLQGQHIIGSRLIYRCKPKIMVQPWSTYIRPRPKDNMLIFGGYCATLFCPEKLMIMLKWNLTNSYYAQYHMFHASWTDRTWPILYINIALQK